ncbi:MAG: endopeptidase La [Gammaproteobacteria bacterium]|nr:endopeptidase La [Gammaproteobacteria bacterium]
MAEAHYLPVLPLKNTVVYPELIMPLFVGRQKSLNAVKAAAERESQLICVAQRNSELDAPKTQDLHAVGTIVHIKRIERQKQGSQVVVQGIRRCRITRTVQTQRYLSAEYVEMDDVAIGGLGDEDTEALALLRETLAISRQIALLYDSEHGEDMFQQMIGSLSNPVTQMYRIASVIDMEVAKDQRVLEADDALSLVKIMHEIASGELSITQLRQEIATRARSDLEQNQREHLLRQQKRAIEDALGELGDGDSDVTELRTLLDKIDLPEHVAKEANKELKRLTRMSPQGGDYQVTRSYLELISELPWGKYTDDCLDLARVEEVLEEDHYGLEDIKERILENLAVLHLNPKANAPILCFVGPPGVGKSSLGQSIARAMGRIFERISLGGLHDEAELRGHRRTYVGAMPGRIVQAINRADVCNPLLMLDEIDKLGRDFRGDPAAALLEILDPAQNKDFRDNYLNLAFDISKVFFITTANTTEGIPRPLLDRMELLELSGYSDFEKKHIARQYLIPRRQKESGLRKTQLRISDDALHKIIRRYTREAGVRELERTIGQMARKRARVIVEHKQRTSRAPPMRVIEDKQLGELLGPPKFPDEQPRKALLPGVAAGLAWTAVGGEVLYVEAAMTDGEGKLALTGHLGDVMQESAKAARSYVWSMADKLSLDRDKLKNTGLHIHVPQGAVPKDGPSAGITLATAIVSALSGKPVRDDTAMTGELTLTGLVLPVGGIKEKVLAAHRSGMRGLVLPKANEADLQKLPENVREELTVTFAENLLDVVAATIPQLEMKASS